MAARSPTWLWLLREPLRRRTWAELGYVLVSALNAVCALLHVYFRDVRYLVSALLLVLFYATPVIYPLSFTHGVLRTVVLLNPGTGVVQLTRFAVYGNAEGIGKSLISTAVWIVVLTATALLAFRRHERVAVDRL